MEIQITSNEMKELLHPKNTLKLLTGLVGLFFEKVGSSSNGHGEETAVAGDDFSLINGIGPTFARRLQEAGFHTFADLAASTPEHIREVVQAAEWQADTTHWITQAKAML